MKIGKINFSDDIPKESTKAEFVKKYSKLAVFRRVNLEKVYDTLAKAHPPKAKAKPNATSG